jgi:RNA polymerase sigma factor (sigma-70 family)
MSEQPNRLEDIVVEEAINTADLPIEADYEMIKNDPNGIWFKYEEKIRKVANSLGYWKNFDSDELYQQAYLYFIDLCKNYDPYYNGNFIPFDKYLFKNLIIKLRAFIQSYYFRRKREAPTEFSEYLMRSQKDEMKADDKLYIEHVYSLIGDRQEQILKLSMEGYKQQEIGKMLDISQSRVSVIKKKTLKKLGENLKND